MCTKVPLSFALFWNEVAQASGYTVVASSPLDFLQVQEYK